MLELYLKSKGDGGSFKDVKWKYVLPFLKKFISEKEELHLLDIQEKERQDLAVVKCLESHSADVEAQNVLCHALHSHGYRWVSDDFKKFRSRREETEKKLRLSSVPFKAAHEIERADLAEEVRNLLIDVAKGSDRRHWVVLHGMMGSGKSVLAAQALNDPVIALDTFKDDICWIGLGHKDFADDGYLLKVQVLCEHLCKSFRPGNWESCKIFLEEYFVNHPQSLLVLDDVHSERIITKFDFGIPVLVTTKNQNAIPFSIEDRVHRVEFQKGFTLKQSQTLMSKFLRVDENSLPSESVQIHEKYQGSPLVMALVCGNLLHFKNVTDGHWKAIWTRLQNRNLKRIRHHSGDLNLEMAVGCMIEDISNDSLKEKLQDFALFWEDLFVPRKVFDLLWDTDPIDTEEIMCDLESHSLIMKKELEVLHRESLTEVELKPYCYGVHDLILDYLKQCNLKSKVEHHASLVEKYMKKCLQKNGEYNFALLQRDGYIHTFIGYHLHRSERHDLFPKIYFDLEFLQTKIELSGPFDVLSDFRIYGQDFGEQSENIQHYSRFLCQNGGQLFSSRGSDNGAVIFDLIQLALVEPKTSLIYNKALKVTQKRRQQLYYNWCNQRNIQETLMLSHRPHFPKETNWADFSPNGQLVASVGHDNMLKVWDSTTSREISQYQEHEKPVVSCCFSPCGSLVLSASESGELNLWKVPSVNVFFGDSFMMNGDEDHVPITPRPRAGSNPFSALSPNSPSLLKPCEDSFPCNLEIKNTEPVTTCAFSKTNNDQKLLAASGYVSGKVKVWQIESRKLLRCLEGHTGKITSLSFSPKDILASASEDRQILLWDVTSGRILRDMKHEDFVVYSCQFNKTGEILLSAAGKYVWLWNLTGARNGPQKKFDGIKSTSLVKHCAFSPDEQYIAGGTTSGSVIFWSVQTGEIVSALPGHSESVACVRFSKDGKKLLSASSDGIVNLWSVGSQNGNHTLYPSSKNGLSGHMDVKFIDNGTKIAPVVAVLDEANHVRIFTTLEGEQRWESSYTEKISSCCLSPDCKILVYTTEDGSVTVQKFVYNYEKVASKCSYSTESEITRSYFSNCGKWFVTCMKDGSMLRWAAKVVEKQHPVNLLGHNKDILGCRMYLTHDGRSEMLSFGSDGKLKVWDLENAVCTVTVSHGTENVTCGDAHLASNILISGSVDQTLRVWAKDTGKELKRYEFCACVRSCCLDLPGKLIAAGDDDGCITVYKLMVDKPLYEFKRHKRQVFDLHFSSDSQFLVSAGDGLCWWSLNSTHKSNLQQSFSFLGGEIESVSVSPDFSTFVTVDSNGILFILKKINFQ